MALPVDDASIEDVPLEALPSEISSALRETAANPGTEPGDQVVSGACLNHGQHNPVWRLTTKKSELVIIIVATCIALAGLVLQLRANRLSREANQLTREGNAVAEKSYKLQLWDDCHDRQDLQDSNPCQSASSLIHRDVVVRKLQRIHEELNKMVLPSVTNGRSSTFSDGLMDLRHLAGSGMFHIIVDLVSCHFWYLFVLGGVILRRQKWLAEGRIMFDLWVYLHASGTPKAYTLAGILFTGLDHHGACAFALAIHLTLHLVVVKQYQRLRQKATAKDEEAQGHGREEPDLRPLPDICFGKSLAYVQKLERRWRTYEYQQDN